jgi:hypothetical protein
VRARLSLLAALLVAVLAPGCGASGDQARAEKAVLRPSDLPGGTGGGGLGWYADEPDDESVAGRCALFEIPGLHVTGNARSDWYYSPASWNRDWQVTSYSAVYKRSAHNALERVARETTQCIRAERGSGYGIGGLSVGGAKARVLSFPRVGARSRMYEIRSGIGPLDVYDYVVVIQQGRTISLLYLVSGSNGSNDRLIVDLAEAIASRT